MISVRRIGWHLLRNRTGQIQLLDPLSVLEEGQPKVLEFATGKRALLLKPLLRRQIGQRRAVESLDERQVFLQARVKLQHLALIDGQIRGGRFAGGGGLRDEAVVDVRANFRSEEDP